MREHITEAMKAALKSGDKARLGTLRLMLSALKDREIGVGTGGMGAGGPLSEAEALQVLQRMVKQRRDSIESYRQGKRQDLVDQEAAEIAVIEEFLPKQMGEAEVTAAVVAVVTELGAASPKDMGKVMAALKAKYTGQMDFGKASAMVKELLK